MRKVGPKVAGALKKRLADLDAARTVDELLAGRPRVSKDHLSYSVQLDGGYALVFMANHVKNPTNNAGEVDWQRVSRIKITRIGKSDE